MINVTVIEQLTSGLYEGDLPESLLTEGRSMLQAVVSDLAAVTSIGVRYAWDARHPRPEVPAEAESWAIDLDSLVSAPGWRDRFRIGLQHRLVRNGWAQKLATERTLRVVLKMSETCLLIAPESGRTLEHWVRMAGCCRTHVWNCTPAAIRTCGDKLRFWRHCRKHGLPGIPTQTLRTRSTKRLGTGDIVVKPRYGAGCLETRRCSLAEYALAFDMAPHGGDLSEQIAQPWCEGTAASVAAIFPPSQGPPLILPVARQLIESHDGLLEYRGGEIDLRHSPHGAFPESRIREIAELVHRVGATRPGLKGWVGFDLVLPDSPDEPLQLVEVNPRLTTSYVGYRLLTSDNLAAWLLGRPMNPNIAWNAARVRFGPGGDCHVD